MEKNINKCSNLEHSEINANIYCSKCEIYMCNKCENIHSKLFSNHQSFIIKNNSEDCFTGLCKEENHHNLELEFYCKTHNQLCCIACLCKIKKNSIGKHSECEICDIEEIKDDKINKLKENIKCLENLSNTFEDSINKLKELFLKINKNKEELKLKIQTIFTKIRNELNNREDFLLLEVDNEFDKTYFKEEIITKSERLYNKIKLSLNNYKIINKENNNNKTNFLINECIKIENNIRDIETINENVKKCNNSIDLKFIIIPDKEDELNESFNYIKNFVKIYSNDVYKFFNSLKWNKIQIKKNNFFLLNNDKTIKIDYSGCWNSYFLEYIFEKEIEYCICISVNTFGYNLDSNFIGFMNENGELSGSYCICQEPQNCFYIKISSEEIFQGKSKFKVQIKNKNYLRLKFILNLKTKNLDIRDYDSNFSYKIINIIGNKFKLFVAKCNKGTIEYNILPPN